MRETLNKLLFNNLIKSNNISFVKTVITFSVAYQTHEHEDNVMEHLRSLAFVLFPAFIIICETIFLYNIREKLGTPEMDARIGRLTVDVHLTRNYTNVYYHSFFFAKRYIFLVIPLLIFRDQ